ncbi:hypothetical protein [Chondrinema litorale]|uniref:hypothetical protein n=1 Tax=Chondrinema litorale TaxID=2994555 RepID=UPI002542B34F|nr:hypothetical protein [Chondrinema litorale]UZR98846.1 hypothetical protein OQ292_33175 [Chondrinema litorale]
MGYINYVLAVNSFAEYRNEKVAFERLTIQIEDSSMVLLYKVVDFIYENQNCPAQGCMYLDSLHKLENQYYGYLSETKGVLPNKRKQTERVLPSQ